MTMKSYGIAPKITQNVIEQQAPAYEDNSAGVAKVEHRYNAQFITGTTAGLNIKSSAGLLHSLLIGKPTANAVITIYDNTAASGTVIATITFPGTLLSSGPVPILLDVEFTTGLTVVVATAGVDLTVGWR